MRPHARRPSANSPLLIPHAPPDTQIDPSCSIHPPSPPRPSSAVRSEQNPSLSLRRHHRGSCHSFQPFYPCTNPAFSPVPPSRPSRQRCHPLSPFLSRSPSCAPLIIVSPSLAAHSLSHSARPSISLSLYPLPQYCLHLLIRRRHPSPASATTVRSLAAALPSTLIHVAHPPPGSTLYRNPGKTLENPAACT